MLNRRIKRSLKLLLLAIASLGFSLYFCFLPYTATAQSTPSYHHVVEWEQQAAAAYQNHDWQRAIALWQQAAELYQQQGETAGLVKVGLNLAIAHTTIGEYTEAQTRLAQSNDLLKQINSPPRLQAQALNAQAMLQFEQGKFELAISNWQQAQAIYEQLQLETETIKSQLNQAQALRFLGLYRQAIKLLEQANLQLTTQPDSVIKLQVLKNYAHLLALVKESSLAQQLLEQGLTMAEKLEAVPEKIEIITALGDVASVKDIQAALELYQQADGLCQQHSFCTAAQAAKIKLAILEILVEQDSTATNQLITTVETLLASFAPSYYTIQQHLNFAHHLQQLQQSPSLVELTSQVLQRAIDYSEQLQDLRGYSYALGAMGKLYVSQGQWQLAEQFTQQALAIANQIIAPEIGYQWQWQLGQIYWHGGNRTLAKASYHQAVDSLDSFKFDLVGVSPELQYSWQDSIEPVYREYIGILLDHPDQEELIQARNLTESLQLAKVNNFLEEVCIEDTAEAVDQIDSSAAVIYPIILGDRLEIILSLPTQPLKHYSVKVDQDQLINTIVELQQTLVIRSKRQFYQPAAQLYQWLMEPILPTLQQSQIDTLVFVPDGVWRNIPFAALYDGQQFLIQRWNVAVTPGLKLLSPQPIKSQNLKAITAGITQAQSEFLPLNYVAQELETISSLLPTKRLLDQEFTLVALEDLVQYSSAPIVHIATHGQFSSNLAETFLLAWNSTLDIAELSQILHNRTSLSAEAIELLVLSACETATGDRNAALGLAGIAVKAGARSTLATLWSVNDQATAEIMHYFYQGLTQNQLNKAEAIRQAQLQLIDNPRYQHPFYWAGYVLIGNWM